MPIYEFVCESCGKKEEILCQFCRKSEEASKLRCSCGCDRFVEKFGVNIGGNSSLPDVPKNIGSCSSSCGSGSCGGCSGC